MKDTKPDKGIIEKFIDADNPRSYSMFMDKDGKVTINGTPPDNITKFTDPAGETWIRATLDFGGTRLKHGGQMFWCGWNGVLQQPFERLTGGGFWKRVSFNAYRWLLEHWWWAIRREWEGENE